MARILVIESDDHLAETLQELLTAEGHEAARTGSGRAALLLAARERWDVVVLGLRTDELAGQAVLRVLDDAGAAAVIVMSASTAPTWRKEAFSAGAAACLDKPFQPSTLFALVDAILAGAARGPGPPGDVRQLDAADLDRIGRMSDEELDALPFGILRVDERGVITAYNAFESRAAGRARAAVVGHRFRDVVPCAMVAAFAGRMDRGFAERRLDEVLRFLFPVREATCVVTVRLYCDGDRGEMWIFVTRRAT